MIRISVAGVTGYGIEVQPDPDVQEKVREDLPHGSQLAFVDLSPTDSITSFITDLRGNGHEVVGYYDHHREGRKPRERNNLTHISRNVAGTVKYVTRRQAVSCVELVEQGEWRRHGATAVFFHSDLDGFFTFLKGCRVSYPGMDEDAITIDGNSRGRKLSDTGRLVQRAFYSLVPYFTVDPEKHVDRKTRLLQSFADWIAHGCPQGRITKVRELVEAAHRRTDDNGYKCAQVTDRLPGNVALCDFRPLVTSGERISTPTWRRRVRARFHVPLLFCSISLGHLGEQVFVELPSEWKDDADLRDYLPNGVMGNVFFRVQVPLDRWEEFLANWRERSPCA